MKEKKDYQRTIRMTQTTRHFLEQSEGKGLNEKFENLVYNAHIKEKELSERHDYLEQINAELEKEIKEKRFLLQDKVADIERFVDKILNI